MFIIGNILAVKTSCVLANMLLNKHLFVIGMLLQSLVIIKMLYTLLVLWETYNCCQFLLDFIGDFKYQFNRRLCNQIVEFADSPFKEIVAALACPRAVSKMAAE